MRTVSHNDDNPSEGSSSGGDLGTGYEADFEEGYGPDIDDTYDEDEYDEDKPSDDGATSVDETDDGLDVDLEGVDVTDLSESESEEILVDALEEEYGENADEVLDDLEESTGMSAHEILEVLDEDYDTAAGVAATSEPDQGDEGVLADADVNPFDA